LTWLIPSKEFQAKLPPVFQPFRLHAPLESLQSSFNVLGMPLAPYGGGKERRQRMSVKPSSHSRIKTIKVICDRCKQIVEGIRGEEFIAGFYDMTKWEEYRRENEQYVCDSCMFADPKYVERYGSCF
jgi:hypothetical protein